MTVIRVQTKAWHARRLWAVLAIWLLAVMTTTATAPSAMAATAPSAPTLVSAVPGNAQATVNWTASVATDSPVTGYEIIPQIVGGAVLPAIPTLSTLPSGTAIGLINGTSYTFTVRATSVAGSSAASSPPSAAITVGVPNAPVGAVTAVPGNGQATVSWTASVANGTPVTGYKIIPRISPSGPDLPATVVGLVATDTVTGLANGISYTFTVVATSLYGDSLPSSASTPVIIPAPAAPDAPTNVTAVPGNGQATVSWTASATHGTPVTSYTVFANGAPVITPVIAAADPPPTSVTVTGLTNGDTYTFTVVAHSNAGDSAASVPSAPAIYAGRPEAPTNVTAVVVPVVGAVTVSWTASVENGLPVTGYTIYPSDTNGPLTPQDFPGTDTTATVTGLTGGMAYTFLVQAYTATLIASPSSAPTTPVTPTTPPGQPTSVTAVSGNGQATVSWIAPVADGGAPVTGYKIIPQIVSGPALPATVVGVSTTGTVTGLANGVSYTFTVVATNAVGDSVPSAASTPPVIPAPAVPSAPTNVTAVPGDGQATVSWTASVTNGMPVTGYTVTAWGPVGITAAVSPPGTSVPGDVTSATVTGLTNGTAYTFTVVAHSTVGDSAPSLPSAAVVPGTPAAPTNVTAVAGPALGAATVSWTASVENGLPVIFYSVIASDGVGSLPPVLVLGTTTATVPGLTGGTTYTFTVQAWTSGIIASPVSVPSNSVTAITVPSPPTSVSATAGNSSATVTWTTSADTGSPVTGYQIIPQIVGGVALPATVVGVGTSGTVTGLSNGVSYTFTVIATSAVGDSVPSLPSAPVTPAAAVPDAPTDVLAVPGDGEVTVSWTASIENGTPVTGYTVTPSDINGPLPLLAVDVAADVTTATVIGLTNGTAYTFTVVAHSAAGDSASSTPVTSSPNPITAYWITLGGLTSYLGAAVGDEFDWAVGRGQDYEGGSIYWSAGTGAHAVHGAILDDYKTFLGSPVLGLPTNDETPTGDGVGRFNHFSGGGAIYWTPDTGAHAVYGAIYEKWVEFDQEAGRLGYPITDETATPDGVGRFNHFSKGASIYWTPDTGAHAIYGAIRDKWEAFDWEKGVLGYPTNDESATGDGVGRFSQFSGGGAIYWTPSGGAHAIYGAIYEKWVSLNWEYGRLGYPTSDEYGIPGGRRSNFVGGTITWRPDTGTSVNYN